MANFSLIKYLPKSIAVKKERSQQRYIKDPQNSWNYCFF